MPTAGTYGPQYTSTSHSFLPLAGSHQRGMSHPYFGRALAERLPSQPWVQNDQVEVIATGQSVVYQDRSDKFLMNNPHPEIPPTDIGSVTITTYLINANVIIFVRPSSPDLGGQDIFMPQTPGLDTSSITPVTPASQFPITPTSGTSHDGFVIKDDGFSYKTDPDREVDPTTLFVGGLEMTGPGAWDEERVKTFFSRFGGLESVKVVRPGEPTRNFLRS